MKKYTMHVAMGAAFSEKLTNMLNHYLAESPDPKIKFSSEMQGTRGDTFCIFLEYKETDLREKNGAIYYDRWPLSTLHHMCGYYCCAINNNFNR